MLITKMPPLQVTEGLHPAGLTGLSEVHEASSWPQPPQATADLGEAGKPVPANQASSLRLPLGPALVRRTSVA